ncbi:MAG TPA: hypothetical protein VD766_06860 [Solirubrobacterales bacterium]|nr:hypothetical protein [Solirubrobacterales bacterium]
MDFLKLKRIPRVRLVAALAACATFAIVASAAAVVYIYKNEFGSGKAYREIDQTGGGGNACDESYSSGSKSMRIEVSGKTFCEYSPPVTGDASQPDHEIVADGRILDATPKKVRKQAYLGVRVRVGNDTFYELRINPKEKEYKLNRTPSGGGSGLPLSGGSNQINPLGKKNKLRLRITDGTVTGFVNGNSIVTYDDPNPGQVTGRKVAFGVGSTKGANNGPIGVFKAIKVGVPTP